GKMARVPVEALTDKYTVSYVPSGSVFARLSERHRPLRGGSLLALGDPAFEPPPRSLPEPPEHGVLVKVVLARGNAARPGLQAGHVLRRVGGSPVKSLDDLKTASAGTGQLPVRYWRMGQEADTRLAAGRLDAVLDPRPAAQAVQAFRDSEALLTFRSGHRRLP